MTGSDCVATAAAAAEAVLAKKSRSGIPAGDDVVFIGGIPRGATQGELRTFFQDLVGSVKKVRFVIDHSTRHHKGYGFARFHTAETAAKVVELNKKGLHFNGKLLNIGTSMETFNQPMPCNGSTSDATSAATTSDSGSSRAEEEGYYLPELEDENDGADAPVEAPPAQYAQQVVPCPVQTQLIQVPVQQQIQYVQVAPQQQVVYVQPIPQYVIAQPAQPPVQGLYQQGAVPVQYIQRF